MIFSEAMKCEDQGQSAELGEMMAQGVKSAHPGMQPHVAHPWMHSAAHKVVIRAGVEAHGAAASNRSGAIEHPSRPFQRLNLSTASNSGPR